MSKEQRESLMQKIGEYAWLIQILIGVSIWSIFNWLAVVNSPLEKRIAVLEINNAQMRVDLDRKASKESTDIVLFQIQRDIQEIKEGLKEH